MRPAGRNLLIGLFLALAGCSSAVATPEAAPTTAAAVDVPADTTASSVPPTLPPEAGEASTEVIGALPGRIVVVSPLGDLVVSKADGTDLNVLDRAADSIVSQPTWSSDGNRMSWTEFSAQGAAVRVHDFASGGSDTYPTPTPRFYHSWNADGTAVATLGSSPSGPIQLDVIDAISGDSQEVAVGQPFYLDWEETRSEAVIAVNASAVGRVDIAEGTGRDVPISAPLGAFQSPSVLADGSFLVALAASPNGSNLVRVAPDDTETVIASFDGGIVMATSPDSSSVAVLVSPDPTAPQLEQASFQTTPELESGRISIVDLATGDVSTLPHRDVVTVNWSPDGTWLAALQRVGTDARWIYQSDLGISMGPVHRPSDAMLGEYLPFADQYNRSHTWWAPDSSAFVFSGSIDDRSGIWVDVIDDDLGPALVAAGSIAFWSPR